MEANHGPKWLISRERKAKRRWKSDPKYHDGAAVRDWNWLPWLEVAFDLLHKPDYQERQKNSGNQRQIKCSEHFLSDTGDLARSTSKVLAGRVVDASVIYPPTGGTMTVWKA